MFNRSHDPVAIPRVRICSSDADVRRYLDGCICSLRLRLVAAFPNAEDASPSKLHLAAYCVRAEDVGSLTAFLYEVQLKNPGKHSQETIERMKANAEAARKRLARLNKEYLLRRQIEKVPPSKPSTKAETFAEAVLRIAKQERITI